MLEIVINYGSIVLAFDPYRYRRMEIDCKLADKADSVAEQRLTASAIPVLGSRCVLIFLVVSRAFDGVCLHRRLGLALQAFKNPDRLLATVLSGCANPPSRTCCCHSYRPHRETGFNARQSPDADYLLVICFGDDVHTLER